MHSMLPPDVRYTEGPDTVVAGGARVAIIPAVAGG
jgi:molybdopterin converting factor small subunit